jgi:ABC-type Mn2+/Zn2+ transport system permease subunit
LPPVAGAVGIQPAPGQKIAKPKPGETLPPVPTPLPGQTPSAGLPAGVAPPLPTVAATPGQAPGLARAPERSQSSNSTTQSEVTEQPENGDPGTSFDFMRQALLAGVLVALMCSYLGLYVVLKRIVFVGVALSEMSSAGIALALLVGFSPMLGAISFMLLGVLLFSMHWSPRRVPHESYIGVVYSVAAALGILMISKSAQGESHMLTLLQGDVLTVNPQETLQMLAVFAGVALIHLLFTKEFVLVSFDREAANTLGFRAARWDMLLFLTIGIVIAFSIRSVGVLMTSSMLILPAATALLITNRLRHAWIAAPVLGVLPVGLGLYLSYQPRIDLPASALIVALSFLLLLPALVYSVWKRRA